MNKALKIRTPVFLSNLQANLSSSYKSALTPTATSASLINATFLRRSLSSSRSYTFHSPFTLSSPFNYTHSAHFKPDSVSNISTLCSTSRTSTHIIRRSLRSYTPAHFRPSERTFKPHSSKPQKFIETSSSIKTTSLPTNTFIDLFPTPRESFVFSHGASGIPKHQDKLVSLASDGKCLSVSCGEDSFFRRRDSLGVADGVGGWRHAPRMEHVIADSSIYSRKLMHHACVELEKYDNIDDGKYYRYNDVDPVQILETSHTQSVRDCALEGVIGSSTALIAVLRGDELRIANLGDCGIAIIRHNDIFFRNEEQQHSFNYPYQLGTGPFDSPDDAQTFTVKVKPGDVVVMGSDGVFDNLFEADILEEVSKMTCTAKNGITVESQTISDALAWRAKSVSEDLYNGSPFQSRAMQEGMYYQGGKMDDITVLVAVITDIRDSNSLQQ